MGYIRHNKKKLLSGLVIGLAGGCLFTAVFFLVGLKVFSVKENEEIQERTATWGCMLKSDGEQGKELNKDDLIKIKIFSDKKIDLPQEDAIIGKSLSGDLKKGIIITENALYKNENINSDIRTYFFDFIQIPEDLSPEDIFDIRITYPNGEDYVVACGKHIETKNDNGFFINASEKELLMLSGAKVDMDIYDGTKIYASVYIWKYQEISLVNYPVNRYIMELAGWNPNMLEEVEEDNNWNKRKILENNLYEFTGIVMSKDDF